MIVVDLLVENTLRSNRFIAIENKSKKKNLMGVFQPKELFVEPLASLSASNVSKRNGETTVSGVKWDLGANDMVVVQLGSRNLRIGMARDAFPRLIPCTIATNLTSSDKMQEEKVSIMVEPSKAVVGFNKNARAEVILGHNDIDALDWLTPNPILSGLALAQVDPKYERLYPLHNGRFTENTRLCQDYLYTIIQCSVSCAGKRLVLVVEEEMNEAELAVLCDLALNQLGVTAVCFLKEAVAACFGTGASSALVIDIGATRTRISIVEDGTTTKSVSSSRIFMLQACMREAMEREGWPAQAIEALAVERILTLDESERNSAHGHAVEVTYRRQGQDAQRYDLRAGNSRFLIPERILFEASLNGDESNDDLISMISLLLADMGEEQVQKLVQNIILVGGYSLIPHLPQMLLDRLLETGLTGSVIGGMDPRQVAWKGGAVYSRLESINDGGWLTREEWNAKGVRALHEKCIFPFTPQ